MGEFKRERRYAVIKLSDLDDFRAGYSIEKQAQLKDCFMKQLDNIGGWVDAARKEKGKPPLECVVVESDWPEYEVVWKMIEDRMTGKKAANTQELLDRISDLERRNGGLEDANQKLASDLARAMNWRQLPSAQEQSNE